MVAVTARFRVLYILLLIDIGSRRIVHCNVTEHPTADWTLLDFLVVCLRQFEIGCWLEENCGSCEQQSTEKDILTGHSCTPLYAR
jgi:hypothetical protein